MANNETSSRKASNKRACELRRRAEEALKGREVNVRDLSAEEIQNLVHELHVHQIELEMQNDELRKTQLELEFSRDKYTDLYDFAPAGYMTLDEKSLILEANLTSASLLGLERGQLKWKRLTDFISREDQDIFYRYQKNPDGKSRKKCEIRMKRIDGTEFQAKLEGVLQWGRDAGSPKWRTSISDITERKRMEASLTKSKLFAQRIAEVTPDLLYIYDIISDRHVYLNHQTAFGYTEAEIRKMEGRMSEILVHPEDLPALMRRNRAFASQKEEDNKVSEVEVRLRHADGQWRWHQIRAVAFSRTSDGTVREILGTCRDVTEQKKMVSELQTQRKGLEQLADERESELAKTSTALEHEIVERKKARAECLRASQLASLGELAAGVAHEVNNPINGIINYAQILLNDCAAEDKECDIAHRIIKESNRIADIVKSLLSFARDTEGRKSPASIADILSEALALTKATMRKEGIKINIDIPPDLPQIVVQPEQIQQVFMNIISNARYALNRKINKKSRDKLLEIHAERVSIDGNPFIRIIFKDWGCGMASDILEKAMNPFFSTKPRTEGTGLGLSISYGIIRDHGGQLSIESDEGMFTRVTVDLPAE